MATNPNYLHRLTTLYSVNVSFRSYANGIMHRLGLFLISWNVCKKYTDYHPAILNDSKFVQSLGIYFRTSVSKYLEPRKDKEAYMYFKPLLKDHFSKLTVTESKVLWRRTNAQNVSNANWNSLQRSICLYHHLVDKSCVHVPFFTAKQFSRN